MGIFFNGGDFPNRPSKVTIAESLVEGQWTGIFLTPSQAVIGGDLHGLMWQNRSTSCDIGHISTCSETTGASLRVHSLGNDFSGNWNFGCLLIGGGDRGSWFGKDELVYADPENPVPLLGTIDNRLHYESYQDTYGAGFLGAALWATHDHFADHESGPSQGNVFRAELIEPKFKLSGLGELHVATRIDTTAGVGTNNYVEVEVIAPEVEGGGSLTCTHVAFWPEVKEINGELVIVRRDCNGVDDFGNSAETTIINAP